MTPKVEQDFSIFPGENWFLYWKTSASLWKKKLSECEINGKVFVPIYWAFHTENNDQFDFGNYRPEANLSKLTHICSELEIDLVFLLPFTPVPFLANGGIPSLLAKHFSKHESGLNICAINQKGEINKLYSFFDTRIFQAYSKFVRRLGQYLIDLKITNSLWGFESFYLENNRPYSFLLDSSVIYEKTFEQFLSSQQNKEDFNDTCLADKKIEFTNIIRDIYKQEAEKFLASNWEGNISFNFLGGSEVDFYQILNDELTNQKLVSNFIESLATQMIPSSILINRDENDIQYLSKDLITAQTLHYFMEEKFSPYLENDHFTFQPFHYFHFEESFVELELNISWNNLGVIEYIKSKWGPSFSYHLNEKFSFDEYQVGFEKIYFFQGYNVSLKMFYEWLKLFMNGANLIINRNKMPIQILKRLESFILENNLSVEKLNFETDLHHITLGEGSMTLFDSTKVLELSAKKQYHFWEKLIDTYSFKSISIDQNDFSLNYIWFSRAVGPGELSYEEIRRLYLYNPTSYVKKVDFEVPQFFSLLKIVNQQFSHIETKPKLIKITLQPKGKIALDWGVFS